MFFYKTVTNQSLSKTAWFDHSTSASGSVGLNYCWASWSGSNISGAWRDSGVCWLFRFWSTGLWSRHPIRLVEELMGKGDVCCARGLNQILSAQCRSRDPVLYDPGIHFFVLWSCMCTCCPVARGLRSCAFLSW